MCGQETKPIYTCFTPNQPKMDANSIRDRSTKFLADSIETSVGSSSGTSQAIASEIEATLYQAHDEETANPYRQDVRTKGLAIKQNNELAGQLVSGQVSGEQVAGMDDEVSQRLRRSGSGGGGSNQ